MLVVFWSKAIQRAMGKPSESMNETKWPLFGCKLLNPRLIVDTDGVDHGHV
jgi:hypothetical protein